ncbi:DNA-directed RNA polymerase subunit beta' [bacterium]|nr:DNA-directed RNA polymerase subunit beta' [bacterium]
MLVNSPSDFDYLEIRLGSPDRIRYWSYGEVEKPETINYRTFKPERKGLFCERIFGPVKDWECSCGKYRRVRYRGIVCERCGVEVTHSKVRRERMGHIELAAPVSHIWFLKGIPSYMGLVLDMSSRQLEEVIYYDSYVVTQVGPELNNVLSVKQILSIPEYLELKEKYKDFFQADSGASAIRDLLKSIDLNKLAKELREQLGEVKGQKRVKVTKRLRIADALAKSGNRPEWMVLEVLPVMPPDLRPMVQLEGGRFATSDLNDLYRRVVNRNNRLKRLIDIGAPEMIVRNEKRMLQESVDVLISNGKRGKSITGANGRPLKSLGNIIEGKQGRFRQNLLGKRVDYSGRSVIVVGPKLKFYQCGLPKEMALELFKPFVIRRLVEDGHVTNVKSAKKKIEKRDVVVWDALEEVIKGKAVLLNRAPTLHRLGIQAFEPVLVEGSAIQIHPLVCTAFNADFDGDQMAVHVPLSFEAQAESRFLIMSKNNILSPSNGRPIITPSQDMVLGCYYLTVENPGALKGKGKYFADIDEVLRALESKCVDLQSEIVIRIDKDKIKTTVGRLIFNKAILDVLEEHGLDKYPYINEAVSKKVLGELLFKFYMSYGNEVASVLADRIKALGFKYATLSGISISIDDLHVPEEKSKIIKRTEKEIAKLSKLEEVGAITERERVLRSHDLWREAITKISEEMIKAFGSLNNVLMMANSGARGNMDQVRQLAGIRGLMSDSQGRVVNVPIKANFKEGLSLTEYFISSYGARKGLVDTALRTADSGYLTRRLVDVAQDVMITEEDCGDKEGLEIQSIKDGINIVVPLAELIEGRVALETIKHPNTKKVIVKKEEIISEDIAKQLQENGIDAVKTRNIYKCKAKRGLCQKCYGVDLATGAMINLGEAVGIIAAQSIGEPGTQLTMRTFHTGGVDLRRAAKIEIKSKHKGDLKFEKDLKAKRIFDAEEGYIWIATSEGSLDVLDSNNKKTYLIPFGSTIYAKSGAKVKKNDLLATYDPTYEYIVSENKGIVKYIGLNAKERTNDDGKVVEVFSENDGEIFVYDKKEEKVFEVEKIVAEKYKEGDLVKANDEFLKEVHLERDVIISKIELSEKAKGKSKKEDLCRLYFCPGESHLILSGAIFYVKEGEVVDKGDILVKERAGEGEGSKTRDIVQGLPRVEELVEARKPKESAILSDLTGVVSMYERDNIKYISVVDKDKNKKEYKIPANRRLRISGKRVEKGQSLTDGILNPHSVLHTKGVYAVQSYLGEEVQKVYCSQGVRINSKHIEVIVKQMTKKVLIIEMGDSVFLPNELIDVKLFEKVNRALVQENKKLAVGERVLMGITRASLNTDSFISAASFQETARVLSDAAIRGKTDEMYGLKENVIIGKLIPAGTGLADYARVSVKEKV